MSVLQATCVGIDVSKDKVDVYFAPEGKNESFDNEQRALLVERLVELQPQWIVVEPTGGYELPWVNAFIRSGLRVTRPHVTRVSYHARGKRLSKTDKLDAQALAHYAQCYQEELRPYQVDEIQTQLRLLYQRRQQLVDMKVEEKNRYHHQELPDFIRQGIKQVIVYLESQIQEMDCQLRELIAAQQDLQEKKVLLQSMVGVGETVAHGLLALLPELGEANRKEIAALVGVVPLERSSGKAKGKSSIRGGRFHVRSLLYLAALSAIRYCPVLGGFYNRLKAKGKSGKQAIVAVMHKMLRMLNAMLKHQQTYQPT